METSHTDLDSCHSTRNFVNSSVDTCSSDRRPRRMRSCSRKSTHNPIDGEDVSRIWRAAFRPEYAETETHRAVTSHFGRHRFTTHWRVTEDLPRPLVKYMRGDTPADDPFIATDAIDVYVHTYYDDIAAAYRERIYQLDLM
jgi:integrase/recombinase XerD